jgi:hypothetical protein
MEAKTDVETAVQSSTVTNAETTQGSTGKTKRSQAHVDANIGKKSETVSEYLSKFLALPVQPKTGYDNYFSKKDGFVNPKSWEGLSVQGTLKMLAVLFNHTARLIAAGGDEAKAMEDGLHGLDSWRKGAVEKALQDAAEAKMEAAIQTLVSTLPNCSPEQARSLILEMAEQNAPAKKQGAKQGIKVGK